MSDGIRAMYMRGGTSKGVYLLADDLPADAEARDRILLGVMGSPDPRQIDGMGGADPLTSKVAIVRRSTRQGVDVDYLFLQVFVDRDIVSDAQNCGNILAGVGPFAIERGLVEARDGETPVAIFMENTGQTAVARIETPGGKVNYAGSASIDGVPGAAAPVPIEFRDTAGSTCGALLPTGNFVDTIDGIEATLIDNGMPCVVLRAGDMGIAGGEIPEALEANHVLRNRLEAIRLLAGPMMNLGDVSEKSVPKMTMVSPALHGGAIGTRTFIPHNCHKTIGVLGAVSVATACLIPGAVGADIARVPAGRRKTLSIEHPTGEMTVVGHLDETGAVARAEVLRTARKIMDGTVFPAPYPRTLRRKPPDERLWRGVRCGLPGDRTTRTENRTMMNELTAADGHRLDCWIEPAQGARKGGVVILQEIFGVTDQLKRVAARYAAQGYEAAVPALFDRKEKGVVVPFDQGSKGLDLMLAANLDETMADVDAAVRALRTGGGKVAVIGFCWGGGLALRAAQKLDIDAAVAFYGTRLPQYLDAPLKAPLMGHFGTTDEHVPAEMLAEVKAFLPDMEIHMYEAGHAFANDARTTHVRQAASLAHERTMAFLADKLG